MVPEVPLILLCGGKSSRMGEPKGLVDARGRPWLERQLDRYRNTGGERVVVVLGYENEKYFDAIAWMMPARDNWLTKDGLSRSVVVNRAPESGPFSSILSGWKAPSGRKEEAAFVLPVDVPVPELSVWQALATMLSGQVRACTPEYRGRGGHPVLLSRTFLDALTHVPLHSPDSRLDAQIQRLPADQRLRVPVDDERVLLNMNEPGDLPKLFATL